MTTIWITRDLYSSSFENDIDKYISGKLKKETHKIEEMFAEAEVFCNLALKAIDYCNKRKEPAFTVNYTKDDIKRIKEKVENAKKIYISKKNVNGGREI